MSETDNVGQEMEASGEPDAVSEEDRQYLLEYVKETEQRLTNKEEIRAANLNPTRPPDTYFSKLDSSLKRNTTFVKKLKNFSMTQLDAVLKDMANLNLTKYVSEVATALVDAKLKMNDISSAIKACSFLHQTYAEFSAHFFENWQRILSLKIGEKIANPSKLRVDLRFYAELVNAGIFTHKQGLPLLGSVLTVLINMDKEEHNNASIILSFCRHCGEDYAGLVPRKARELSEKLNIPIPKSKLLSPDKQQNVRFLLRDYYNSLCKHLLKEHKELQAFEKQNRKILQTRGELSAERKEKLESLQVSYERLFNGVQSYSDTLDEPIPELPVDIEMKAEAEETLKMINEGEENSILEDMWGDEETRRFYEVLPDLTVFLPGSYLKEVPKPDAPITEETLDEEITFDELEETEKVDEPEVETEEPQVSNISNKILLDAFLSHLPNCVNREMIDNAAVDFLINLNTKHNKKKLVKALFGVSRIRLDLLPFYSRLAAILYPVMPDVANDLCLMLKHDFKYHVRKKDQINIESKIKVVRYIGELVKFKLYSKIEALYCLKVLLHDFTHHHIEMACNLLETCGRYLFCSPDSHQRTKVYLEQMMRKKAVTALDSRYVTIIENAYYFVNPPESTGGVSKKDRPPIHEFIRKLLYQDLSKTNTDKVLKWMRKLDWEDESVSSYAIKCLTAAYNVKYLNIRCVGSLLAGLVAHYETIGPHVVDGVLEDIRLCMEINLPKYNQRRIAMVKYLGELYNYRMVESGDIFRTLYLLITFGVSMDHSVPSVLDPPDHLFRIRLVCTLLETCGQYFSGGSSKKKLDYFLVFFQNYYWFKYTDPIWTSENPFPVGIDYMYRDTLTMLRPKMQLFQSYKEAQCAIEELRNILYPSLGSTTTEDIEHTEGESDMSVIVEGDEELLVTSGNGSGDAKGMGDLHFEESEDCSEAQSEEDWTAEAERDDTMGTQENTQGDQSLSEGGTEGVIMDGTELNAALPAGPKKMTCPEDDDFLSALDKMVSDNIQDRMRDAVKPQQVDISVPLHIKSTKKTYEQLQVQSSDNSTMDFILMLRKGNKQQYKNLAVPVSSELAMNLRNREQEQKEEKERVKRLTLNITERQEEEDYQETINQGTRPVTVNLNRERRQKYNHPKGAPDADLIFGPKKIR
ncbi:regulator of nonsense transcripts 2-like [Vespa mandarinia]|uniref:regulator of nonsense transcripts 2-like n=1 Tax=Vespa mandarinia TaxID=7446 RepID=UPI00160F1EE5|nr:regulator of nonsense transcripts 2-like [Vespa mandarinia]XP_046835564.1 regulator of nonsense transcripts 2 [Vespa crabro]XP_047364803.1 regulator of nonsense transcripts 2 [Vespa velutina]XP_047364804.1 regulator of nonsense transcripts 2 [Vespa velutina]XP_047364805.1 regulator of nonsense transcripts 2 [Vespa velutina]